MIRKNQETFWEILFQSIYHFGLSSFFGNAADWKTIIRYHSLVKTARTIMNYHVEYEYEQTPW